MVAGLWQVDVTGTVRSKQTEILITVLAAAASSKSAIAKAMDGYNWANLDIKTICTTRITGEIHQLPTMSGLWLKKR